MKLGELVKTGDWKSEKHVPVIEAPEHVKAGEAFDVKFCVGGEIAHPNTPAHHISWIKLYFVPDGAQLPIEVATADYAVHADTMDAEKPGPVLAEPFSSVKVKLAVSGTFIAQSYCNLHGLWESSHKITVA